ncbi:MAG: cysteine desulfurase family protein [Eggerthellaceae bacterium]|jgi:cysteine desulfurase
MTTKVADGYVYLDWAATAPLCEEAAQAMEPYMKPGPGNIAVGGNPNSLHSPGRAAFEAMEYARRDMARDLGAQRPNEIIFTSGATESDDTVMLGIAEGIAAERGWRTGDFTPHVITTEIEHDAILKPAKRLEQEGFRVTRLAPDRRGFITPEALSAAIDDDTVLVSVQMANSEVGSVQPVRELARIAHEHGAFFHTDATQALGKVPFDVGELGIDAASLSAHKICGPKGVGALYVRAHAPFRDYLLGGGQEEGRRSGTQNVCGIVGFAAACHAAVTMQPTEAARERALRDGLYRELTAIDGVDATVDVPAGSEEYLPNIVHVLVDGYESETMVLRLDMKGFGVSGGSACSSHSLDPSHVLLSMGIEGDRAYGALRISMGRYTTEDDLKRFAAAVRESLDWQNR